MADKTKSTGALSQTPSNTTNSDNAINSPNENQLANQNEQLEKEAQKSLKESIGQQTETQRPMAGNIAAGASLESLELADPSKGDLGNSENLANADIVISEADKKFNELLEDELRKKMVDDEVARKMLMHRQGAGAVNTDNPYNIEAGEKITYIVGGKAVDCNGNVIESK